MRHARSCMTRALCIACVGLVSGLGVAAQEQSPSRAPAAEPSPSNQPAILAGPEVEQDRPARLEQGLTMEMASMTGQLRQLPQPEVRALLERLGSTEVDASLRLTPAQQDSLRRISREHNLAVRAHQEANAEEYARLRIEGGYQAKQPLTRDQITPEIQAARAAFRELVAKGPTNADLQAQLFAALTEAQRAWLDAEMAEILAERERASLEARYAEALAADAVTIDDFLSESGEVDLEKLPARLRNRIARLEPEQRLPALRRVMERRAAPAPAERPRPERARKPVPDLSEVVVPPSDETGG